jgi:iron-sulfur cluster repair protein YtfE (RIC family)
MRKNLALGTWPLEHRPSGPALALVRDDEPDLDLDPDGSVLRELTGDTQPGPPGGEIDRVATAALIHGLLVPQHAGLRTALRGLRATVAGLARRDRSRARIMRRAAAMLDDLHEVLVEQFEHEERSLFPFLQAGVTPIHQLGDLHDHHDDVDARLRRLRALTFELRSAEVSDDTLTLFDGLGTLEGLARRHRAAEQQALLTRYS